jgi:hypothetical protein
MFAYVVYPEMPSIHRHTWRYPSGRACRWHGAVTAARHKQFRSKVASTAAYKARLKRCFSSWRKVLRLRSISEPWQYVGISEHTSNSHATASASYQSLPGCQSDLPCATSPVQQASSADKTSDVNILQEVERLRARLNTVMKQASLQREHLNVVSEELQQSKAACLAFCKQVRSYHSLHACPDW